MPACFGCFNAVMTCNILCIFISSSMILIFDWIGKCYRASSCYQKIEYERAVDRYGTSVSELADTPCSIV